MSLAAHLALAFALIDAAIAGIFAAYGFWPAAGVLAGFAASHALWWALGAWRLGP